MWAEEKPSSVGPGETEESLQLHSSLQSLSSPSTEPPVGDHAFNTWPYEWDLIIKTSHFLTCIYCFFPASTLAKIFSLFGFLVWFHPGWKTNYSFYLLGLFYGPGYCPPWFHEHLRSLCFKEIYKCWSDHTGWWCSWLYAHTSDFLASCQSGG